MEQRVIETREVLDELVAHFDNNKNKLNIADGEFERRFCELIGLVDMKVHLIVKDRKNLKDIIQKEVANELLKKVELSEDKGWVLKYKYLKELSIDKK